MAGPQDFFSPGEWQDPLADPKARAALLQTGIALMQRPGWGETPFAQFGNAVGQGAGAVARQEHMDQQDAEQARKQQETDSKGELNAAKADAAASRSLTAGAMADVARQRLDNEKDRTGILRQKVEAAIDLSNRKYQTMADQAQQRIDNAKTAEERRSAELDLKTIVANARMEQDKIRTDIMGRRVDNALTIDEGKNTRAGIQNKVRVSLGYESYKKNTEAAQAAWDKNSIMPGGKKIPRPVLLDPDQWLNQRPLLRSIYGNSDEPLDNGASAPGTSTTPAPATGGRTTAPGPAPAPTAAAPPSDPAALLAQARAALAAGKSRAAVEQRLREMGVDPAGL